MPIALDRSKWPVVIVRFVGTPSDEEFARYLAIYDELLAEKQRYGLVFDALAADVPTARRRAMQAKWIRDHSVQLAEYCLAGAFVIGSPLIRGALTAIFWIQPMPFPHVVCGKVEEGERWVRQCLTDIRR
ncbi:hypothetical protein BH09MYX1_BH09MYX1_05970 [soil metagenome]